MAETLRRHPRAHRSLHPVLSFTGVNVEEALARQSLAEPLGPIAWLAEFDADILLLGVDHTANTSLHYAERLAGRKPFVRWALTAEGVVVCPGFPGCPDGFGVIAGRLEGVARRASLGEAEIALIPMRDLLHVAVAWIRDDPRALLCNRPDCERCGAVRASLKAEA